MWICDINKPVSRKIFFLYKKKQKRYRVRNAEREKKIAEDVKKRRRRPLAVILVLCALLIVVAIVFNAMIKDFQQSRLKETPAPTLDPYLSTLPPEPFMTSRAQAM